MKVIVVGSGIVGAAAARKLQQAGHEVQIISNSALGSLQSAGATRIFRLGHQEEEFADKARQALLEWRRLEEQLGVQLLNLCGLVLTGASPQKLSTLSPQELTEHNGPVHPLSRQDERFHIEQTGGYGQLNKALSYLTNGILILRDDVSEVYPGGVALQTGRHLHTDRVVVCAGVNTHQLLGLKAPPTWRAVRFSYRTEKQNLPCWIQRDPRLSEPFYALPDTPHTYAVGLSQAFSAEQSEEEKVQEHRKRIGDIVRKLMPDLDPEPVRTITCLLRAPETDSGFTPDIHQIIEQEKVLGITGTNLFKFAPYLGKLAAEWVKRRH